MPRKRQVSVNKATREQIKSIAWSLMAEHGTTGLSLRAIARQMDMTAPALYHYFASMDDLITALIVDAFTGHADFVRAARDETTGAAGAKLYRALLAYREWAVQTPTAFQLIYGNPIPGYDAPSEVTTPAARLTGQVFMEAIVAAVASGELYIDAISHRPPGPVAAHYATKFGMAPATQTHFQLLNQTWALVHGAVSLEVYGHGAPVVGDPATFYDDMVRGHLSRLGLDMD